MKRTLDLVVSTIVVVLLTPAFLLVAIAIKLDSRGPVFFRQERVGRHFRPFRIWKFRTMHSDAGATTLLTVGDDVRITRIGRMLRRFKIDEFPQLFNVWLGEMSLVGPRPEVAKYVEMFRDEFGQVLRVRPGMTDPASLRFANESRVLANAEDPEIYYIQQILPEKLRVSAQYADRASIFEDVRVIWQTVPKLFGG